jgi:predicted homoserine dehydrogenase-like protein
VIDYDIRFGVFVVFEGDTEYVRNCFREYMVRTDDSGRYACLYKRWHLIGLEVGISVASVGLRGEATGAAICFNADAVATAKRDLKAGETLDGEGGYTVWGKLLPASASLAAGALPLGLTHGARLLSDVGQDAVLRWSDVAMDETLAAFLARREMEGLFGRVAPRQRVA